MWLALESGIAPSAWADEGPRAIATAVKMIEDARRQRGTQKHGKS